MGFKLSAIQRRNLRKVLPFSFFAMMGGFLFAIVEQGILGGSDIYPSTGNEYSFQVNIVVTLVAGFMIGALVGFLETLFFNRLFKNSSFFVKVFVKSLIYVLVVVTIIAGLASLANAFQLGMPVYSPTVLLSIANFIFDFAFLSIIIYVGAILTVMLLLAELGDYLGQSVFRNFVFGKYHRPRQEERIFMFLDMRSSTAIAEKLGHVRYFEFLNQYYSDIIESILQGGGEIYQYVGDEVIVSWPVDKERKRFVQSIDSFYDIQRMMMNRHAAYLKKYDVTPEFKAGMHFGIVSTGEIGQIKKEIVFTGDVLNTTARIQGMCNELGRDFLLSRDLKEEVEAHTSRYQFSSVGETSLRGKMAPIELYTVRENG